MKVALSPGRKERCRMRRRRIDSSDLWRVAKLWASVRQRQRWTWRRVGSLERGSCGHRDVVGCRASRLGGDRKKRVDRLDLEYGFLATRTAGGVKENIEKKKKEREGSWRGPGQSRMRCQVDFGACTGLAYAVPPVGALLTRSSFSAALGQPYVQYTYGTYHPPSRPLLCCKNVHAHLCSPLPQFDRFGHITPVIPTTYSLR